jgi:hypothetical protein
LIQSHTQLLNPPFSVLNPLFSVLEPPFSVLELAAKLSILLLNNTFAS